MMETDPTDLFGPRDDGGGSDEKDPMAGVEYPGWWSLVGGVWRWMTDPVPRAMT